MSSDDEPAPSPVFGASSSKDCASVTPIASESDFDGGAKKKVRQYKFPRVKWDRVISITKGANAEMDDEARNVQIAQGARAFMEASKIYKLPGQRNGRPMAELPWFLYSSAHSPVDLDAMLKSRLLIVLHISIVRNARRAR